MRKVLTAGLAALTLGGALVATAVPAQAYPYGGWHGGGWHGGGWGPGAAVAAGVLGLAVGAAIADQPHYYYGPGYYAPPPPAYGYGYGACYARHRVWDPYYGGYVIRGYRYAC
jgi:hypothetical protein